MGLIPSEEAKAEITRATSLKPVFAQPQYSTDNAMGVAVLASRLREG